MNEVQMPQYQSHKKVWALKIAGLETLGGDGKAEGMLMIPENDKYAPIVLDQAYCTKHKPVVGGYYVVYDDGYKSWSPAKAFEEGYTLG